MRRGRVKRLVFWSGDTIGTAFESGIHPVNREALSTARPWAWRRLTDGLPPSPRCLPREGIGRPFNLRLEGGPERWLHHRYDPAQEAMDLVRSCHPERAQALVVAGFGAGWVVEQALAQAPLGCSVTVAVIDPHAFQTTLNVRDVSVLLADPRLSLALGTPREIEAALPPAAHRQAVILPSLLQAAGSEFTPLIEHSLLPFSAVGSGLARRADRSRDNWLSKFSRWVVRAKEDR